MRQKLVLHGLGWLTILGFGGAGIGVAVLFQHRDLIDLFQLEHISIQKQLIDGLLFGAIASLNVLWLLYGRLLQESRTIFTGLIKQFNINLFDIFFLSFCAGVGEEIFFRGAIQYWWGIWPTAIFFVAIHGYLNPSDWRISIYGILMVFIVAGMGYLYVQSGLIASMTAHTLIDIAIFTGLKYYPDLGSRIDPQ